MNMAHWFPWLIIENSKNRVLTSNQDRVELSLQIVQPDSTYSEPSQVLLYNAEYCKKDLTSCC